MVRDHVGKTKRTWRGRGLLRTLLLAMTLVLLVPKSVLPGPVLKIGDPVPRIMLHDLTENKITIPDSVKGTVAIIHFWTEGCSSCTREMPAIETLYLKYRNKGLIVVAVNVGQSKEQVRAFIRKIGITYPVLLDPSQNAARQYGALVVPMTFFLDRNGFIKYKILGEASGEILNRLVLKLL